MSAIARTIEEKLLQTSLPTGFSNFNYFFYYPTVNTSIAYFQRILFYAFQINFCCNLKNAGQVFASSTRWRCTVCVCTRYLSRNRIWNLTVCHELEKLNTIKSVSEEHISREKSDDSNNNLLLLGIEKTPGGRTIQRELSRAKSDEPEEFRTM